MISYFYLRACWALNLRTMFAFMYFTILKLAYLIEKKSCDLLTFVSPSLQRVGRKSKLERQHDIAARARLVTRNQPNLRFRTMITTGHLLHGHESRCGKNMAIQATSESFPKNDQIGFDEQHFVRSKGKPSKTAFFDLIHVKNAVARKA